MKFNLAIRFSLLSILTCSGLVFAYKGPDNVSCGIIPNLPLTNAYGPFDFTNPEHQDKFSIVLQYHFTPEVERLIQGSSGSIRGDIDYTLRAIPNYHRALYAVARLERQQGKPTKYYTAECYFKRAIYFQPRDATSRMLFAMHLHMTSQLKQAKTLYKQALKMRPNGAELNYNYGLLLVDMKQYKLARQAAKIAYNKGYPLQGLKKKLAKH